MYEMVRDIKGIFVDINASKNIHKRRRNKKPIL